MLAIKLFCVSLCLQVVPNFDNGQKDILCKRIIGYFTLHCVDQKVPSILVLLEIMTQRLSLF